MRNVTFDNHYCVEILDEEAAAVVFGGAGVAQGATEAATDVFCMFNNASCGNKSCFNKNCANEICIGGSNTSC